MAKFNDAKLQLLLHQINSLTYLSSRLVFFLFVCFGCIGSYLQQVCSVIKMYRLFSCVGSRARGSVVAAQGQPVGSQIPRDLRLGIQPTPPTLQGKFLNTGPPGKPLSVVS